MQSELTPTVFQIQKPWNHASQVNLPKCQLHRSAHVAGVHLAWYFHAIAKTKSLGPRFWLGKEGRNASVQNGINSIPRDWRIHRMAHRRKKNRHEDRRFGLEVNQWYKSKMDAALERIRPSLKKVAVDISSITESEGNLETMKPFIFIMLQKSCKPSMLCLDANLPNSFRH